MSDETRDQERAARELEEELAELEAGKTRPPSSLHQLAERGKSRWLEGEREASGAAVPEEEGASD